MSLLVTQSHILPPHSLFLVIEYTSHYETDVHTMASQPQLYLLHGSMPAKAPKELREKLMKASGNVSIPNETGVWAMSSWLAMAVDANPLFPHTLYQYSINPLGWSWHEESLKYSHFFLPLNPLLATYGSLNSKPAFPFILSFSCQQSCSMSIFPLWGAGGWTQGLTYIMCSLTVGGLVLKWTF